MSSDQGAFDAGITWSDYRYRLSGRWSGRVFRYVASPLEGGGPLCGGGWLTTCPFPEKGGQSAKACPLLLFPPRYQPVYPPTIVRFQIFETKEIDESASRKDNEHHGHCIKREKGRVIPAAYMQ